jgi:hypothetical protein
MISSRPLRRAAGALLGVAVVSMLVSCGREASAPVANGVTLLRHGQFSVEPVFPRLVTGKSVEGVVAFEKVRIVLHRADGTVALDTTVLFPVGADSVVLAASVPLSPSAGAGGETFKLDLGYMNTAGEVVFKGGPVDLTVAPKGSSNQPAPVQIPVKYSGPGASATRVFISPRSLAVTENRPFEFTAVATDAAGTVIPNTPIVWATLDPTRVSLNSSSSGAGASFGVRGSARILAQLLTGPTDTAIVNVTLSPRTIAAYAGDAQRGAVSTALAQPIAVKVTASDGLGVGGAVVAFAVTTGGGSVANATASTDVNGIASTTWTLGPATGEQSVTATATGLTGSPITFRATARSVAPVKLVIASGPAATNAAGTPLPVTVNAVDAQGDIAKTFTGTVTLSLSDGPPSAQLLGTSSRAAVGGVASFTDLKVNLVGTGYALRASAEGLQSATSASFAIVPGPAQRLEFGSYPVFGMQAGALDVLSVIARDAAGNVATGFTGQVTVSMFKSPTGTTLDGTKTASAIAGTATFDKLSLTTVGEYQLLGTSPDIVAAKGPAFQVTPGPAARLVIRGGGGQTGAPGAALPQPMLAGLEDRFGNQAFTSGVSISFTASDGGSASPSRGVTNSAGQLSTSWTLGAVSGWQTLTASSANLGSASATAVATGGAVASGGSIVVIDDVNAFDDGNGLAKSGSTFVYGNAQFLRNFLSFSTSGTRAGANRVLLLADRGNYDYTLAGSNWYNFGALLTGLGLTWQQTSLHSVLTTVAPDVKFIIIHTPATYFSVTEINGLKAFAAQGGRILMVGENPAYYYYQAVETALLQGLGSSITIVGECAAWGEVVRSVTHPLTAGYPATGTGGFYQICSSSQTGHGANDTPLMYDSANRIVGTLIKVNTTPLPLALQAPLRAQRAMQAAPSAPRAGSPDMTMGPPRKP